MARIRDIEAIYTAMMDQNFKIYDVRNASNQVMFKNDNEEMLVETAVANLRNQLAVVDGLVKIRIRPKKASNGGNTRNVLEHEVMVGNDPSNPNVGVTGPAYTPSGFITPAQLETALANQQIQFDLQTRINNLEREAKEHSEESPYEKMIAGALPTILQAIQGNPQPVPVPPIHGPQTTSDQTSKEMEDRQRITNAINRIRVVDEDFVNTIEKLADLAETDQSKYQTAQTFL